MVVIGLQHISFINKKENDAKTAINCYIFDKDCHLYCYIVGPHCYHCVSISAKLVIYTLLLLLLLL